MKFKIRNRDTKEIRIAEWDNEYLNLLTDEGNIYFNQYGEDQIWFYYESDYRHLLRKNPTTNEGLKKRSDKIDKELEFWKSLKDKVDHEIFLSKEKSKSSKIINVNIDFWKKEKKKSFITVPSKV
jgi:hypothetical protein